MREVAEEVQDPFGSEEERVGEAPSASLRQDSAPPEVDVEGEEQLPEDRLQEDPHNSAGMSRKTTSSERVPMRKGGPQSERPEET